jgi:hypothetical protein
MFSKCLNIAEISIQEKMFKFWFYCFEHFNFIWIINFLFQKKNCSKSYGQNAWILFSVFRKISWCQYLRKAMIMILTICIIHRVYLNKYYFYSLASINTSEWMKNVLFCFIYWHLFKSKFHTFNHRMSLSLLLKLMFMNLMICMLS